MILNVTISGYVIYIVTSLLDTPFIYLARWIFNTKMQKDGVSAIDNA